ncbi:hypothetical protein DIPPA_26643 [Diplonema papillatum]|nr:hypothetical protein DIPPA_26643 [Diplonema papillatum]
MILCGRVQRRCFFYWQDIPNMQLKQSFAKRSTSLSKYVATYPNAQELPDNTYSLWEKARETRMLHEKWHRNAETALLQFNVMVRQKVRPNLQTYNALLSIMAQSYMELTAFKLFNRMLQQKITPSPETYYLLLQATSPLRTTLRADIDRKLHNAIQNEPRNLIKQRQALLEEGQRAAQGYLQELSTDDPQHLAELSLQKELATLAPKDGLEELDPNSSNATVYVDSLRKAFYGDEWATAGKNSLTLAQRATLRPQVNKLSDMELSMFLAIHRQKRATSRGENIETILTHIQEGFIFEMLKQRQEYVETMKSVLQANERLSERVELEAIGGSDSTKIEVAKMRSDGREGRRRVIRKKRSKKPAKNSTEDAPDAPHETGEPSLVGDLKGSIQGGIQLRGKYKTDYVRLAKRKQLSSLSIKQLKIFEKGEGFELVGLRTKGTKAQHIASIERYLFGQPATDTLAAIPPVYARNQSKGFTLSDVSDEEGNEPSRHLDDEALESSLSVTPYSMDSRTVRLIPTAGGKVARFRVPHVGRTRGEKLRLYVSRSKRTLTRKQVQFLQYFTRNRHALLRSDPEMAAKVYALANSGRDMQENAVTQLKNKTFGLWAAKKRAVRDVLAQHEKRQEQDREALRPLQHFANLKRGQASKQ